MNNNFLENFVIVKRKRKSSYCNHQTEYYDLQPAQMLDNNTLLVWSPFGAPRVETKEDYIVLGRVKAVESLYELQNEVVHLKGEIEKLESKSKLALQINNVIVDKNATIVFFNDGTKEVVKKDLRDAYDFEKALSMACAKKLLGGYTPLKNILEKSETVF